MAMTLSMKEGSLMRRVTFAKAKTLKRQKFYRNRQGELFAVRSFAHQNGGPNWRITLEDGREFLADPKTVLEVES